MPTATTTFHLPTATTGWLPSHVQLLRFLFSIKKRQALDQDLPAFVRLAEQINHATLWPQHRLVLAQRLQTWLRRRFASWQELAYQQEVQKPNPSFIDLIHALEALAVVFKGAVAQARPHDHNTLAPAILGGLETHLLWLRTLMERYQEVPPPLWNDSHQLFRIAHEQAIALRAQNTGSGEIVAIQQLYIELALIGVIDAYRQSPGLLGWMTHYLHRYAAALPLTPYEGHHIPVGADSLPGLFLIDLNNSQGPIAPWTLHANHPWLEHTQKTDCLVLDTRPLESLLPEHLRLLEEGEDPALIHVTLTHLPKNQQRELLEQIWQALLPDSRDNVRKEIRDQTVHLHIDFKEVCLRLRRRSDIAAGRTLSDQQLLAPSGSRPVVTQSQWRLADISRTGLRVVNDNLGEQILGVGQLVAIEPDEQTLKDTSSGGYIKDLALLQVRWLRQNLRGGVQVGLRKLGDRPRAVELHLDEQEPGVHASATCIAIVHDKTDTLIIPSSLPFKKGLTGRLIDEHQVQKIRLGEEISKTRHFQQVVYWELPAIHQ